VCGSTGATFVGIISGRYAIDPPRGEDATTTASRYENSTLRARVAKVCEDAMTRWLLDDDEKEDFLDLAMAMLEMDPQVRMMLLLVTVAVVVVMI
jgi:hypothetical protein